MTPKHYMSPAAHAAILEANRAHHARLAAMRAKRVLHNAETVDPSAVVINLNDARRALRRVYPEGGAA